MSEADIIQLGARGRPGRGNRGSSPSRAARTLAPPGPRASGPAPGSSAPGSAVPGSTGPPFLAPVPGPDPDDASGDREGDQVLARALAFLRRRLTGAYEIDDLGFDAELTSTLFMSALRPLAERWFRIEVRGVENIPRDGGALVVANHSGTLPVDALMTVLVVHDHADRHLRALGADLVFALPFVSELARKGGVTMACTEDAERLLAGGELVGVWPEGYKGIGKPYAERYRLQRFGRGGFVSAAIRTRVPIVPCSIVGAEEIYPLIGNLPTLARLLGLPYVPITPFFPLLGPLGLIPLPSKWVIEFGEPLRTDDQPAASADDPMLVFNLTDQVRERIQLTLDRLLVHRGGAFS